jgi:hypothetical protein
MLISMIAGLLIVASTIVAAAYNYALHGKDGELTIYIQLRRHPAANALVHSLVSCAAMSAEELIAHVMNWEINDLAALEKVVGKIEAISSKQPSGSSGSSMLVELASDELTSGTKLATDAGIASTGQKAVDTIAADETVTDSTSKNVTNVGASEDEIDEMNIPRPQCVQAVPNMPKWNEHELQQLPPSGEMEPTWNETKVE